MTYAAAADDDGIMVAMEEVDISENHVNSSSEPRDHGNKKVGCNGIVEVSAVYRTHRLLTHVVFSASERSSRVRATDFVQNFELGRIGAMYYTNLTSYKKGLRRT